MKTILRNSPEAQKYLINLGNPYAAEQIFGDDREGVRDELTARAPTLGDLQNPYASTYLEKGDSKETSTVVVAIQPEPGKVGKLSKTEFRAACRAIFGYYIPAIENGRLRAHYRDFITRNESSSGEKRFRLYSELKRYDLSSIAGINPQFNRERDALTDAKLREIERIVGGNDNRTP